MYIEVKRRKGPGQSEPMLLNLMNISRVRMTPEDGVTAIDLLETASDGESTIVYVNEEYLDVASRILTMTTGG